MHTRLYTLLCTFCFAPALLFSQIEDPEGAFNSMTALDGVWFMPTDRGDRLEIWSLVNDSTMTGRGVRIRIENGDTVTLETMRLEWRGENVTYSVIVRGQNNNKPVAFRLTEWDRGDFLFENPEHDDPKKIRYILLSNRELQVSTEGVRNNRTVKNEFLFEREFTPGAVEFRLRGGINAFNIRGTGNLPDPKFALRPGWELGVQTAFKGRGGFITLNFELGLVGKFAHAQSEFTTFGDTSTTDYVRDVTYNTTWLVIAFTPEITLKRDGRLSIFAGPYYGLQVFSRTKGTDLPGGENKLFDANNDFKKNDLGLLAGMQYKLNFGKKDLDGILGARVNFGLANIDNLYGRDCNNGPLCNGRISFTGVSLYYSVNLVKL